jgi:hypothetical protein
MSNATFESGTWPADIAQLLDDHHLVVLSDHPAERARFHTTFGDYLRSILDTQVVAISGEHATDLASLCAELRKHLPHDVRPKPTMRGIVNLLRNWPGEPKRLYIMWTNADATLEADMRFFARVANAIFAVAVEHEHLSTHRLILQRAIFLGTSKLGAYAEDHKGQFSKWLDAYEETRDGEDSEDLRLWEAQSCVERPPVLIYRIDG